MYYIYICIFERRTARFHTRSPAKNCHTRNLDRIVGVEFLRHPFVLGVFVPRRQERLSIIGMTTAVRGVPCARKISHIHLINQARLAGAKGAVAANCWYAPGRLVASRL